MLPHETEQRRLLMTKQLHAWINQSLPNRKESERIAATRAHLGLFVKGEEIDNEDYMKALRPQSEAVWEFRVRFVKPQQRIFGVFAKPDLVVATHRRDRDRVQWSQEQELVMNEWGRLFPGVRWWVGRRFSDYVTSKGDDRHVGRR